MTKEHILGEITVKKVDIVDTPTWNSYTSYNTATVQLDPTKRYIAIAWFAYTNTSDRGIYRIFENEFSVVSGSTSLWHTTVSYDPNTSVLSLRSDYSASPSCMVVLELTSN